MRQRGERDYTDIKLGRTKLPVRFADITIKLTSVKPKENKYSVDIVADDKLIRKTDENINEQVPFYTARGGHFPYELVIVQVTKDQIVGYLSTPREQSYSPGALGQKAVADSLTKAVERCDFDALRTRLLSGADPNEVDTSVVKGWTPLTVAAALGNVDAARLLLDHGAAIDAKTEFGKTALDVAVRAGNAQVAKLLRSRGAKDNH